MTHGHITRFAPSPTGFLHLGHVVSARHARAISGSSGRFLIRNENIDVNRCTPELSAALVEDLTWLGIVSAVPVRHQSDHRTDYAVALESLKSRGLLYPCFCTRSDIARSSHAMAPDGSAIYAGTCRTRHIGDRAATGTPPAWRLDMTRALEQLQESPSWFEMGRGRIAGRAAAFGDVVLARRDTGLSYHLCVTHDDALQRITCVTRGEDLFEATSVHRVLQALMGWPEPLYAHHALLHGDDGRKLSKRDGAEGVRTLRAAGWHPDEVLRHPRVVACLARTFIRAGMSEDR